jgi:hypothetical protein
MFDLWKAQTMAQSVIVVEVIFYSDCTVLVFDDGREEEVEQEYIPDKGSLN